jgi:acyl-CoA thioesterase-1
MPAVLSTRLRRRAAPFVATLLALWALCLCAVARAADAPVVLIVGDSISSAYGLANGEGWVDLLAAKLNDEGYRQRVVNASISGDTTAGGRARLPALLRQHRPAIVVIELGGNDALRGGSLAATRANLDAMTVAAQGAGAKVVIVGMQLPPNYGPAYVRQFAALFAEVAKERKTAFVPYAFDGFGDDLAQFQSDRIHPNAAAQPRILANVWPALAPLLRKP